jgi:hypothetical protein
MAGKFKNEASARNGINRKDSRRSKLPVKAISRWRVIGRASLFYPLVLLRAAKRECLTRAARTGMVTTVQSPLHPIDAVHVKD